MQCKDIPDAPILERIYEINVTYGWCFRFWMDSRNNERCPLNAFPDREKTPDKLVLAKMRNLHKRGLIRGCTCGCRGDYVITAKGAELINRPPQTAVQGY